MISMAAFARDVATTIIGGTRPPSHEPSTHTGTHSHTRTFCGTPFNETQSFIWQRGKNRKQKFWGSKWKNRIQRWSDSHHKNRKCVCEYIAIECEKKWEGKQHVSLLGGGGGDCSHDAANGSQSSTHFFQQWSPVFADQWSWMIMSIRHFDRPSHQHVSDSGRHWNGSKLFSFDSSLENYSVSQKFYLQVCPLTADSKYGFFMHPVA